MFIKEVNKEIKKQKVVSYSLKKNIRLIVRGYFNHLFLF